MKQFFITVGGVFVGLVLFFFVVPFFILGLIASSISAQSARAPKTNTAVLELDLREGLTDQEPPGIAIFSERKLSVMKVVTTLRRAETDSKVKSLLVRLPEAGMTPAAADELRLAFIHFRKAGKPILAHSQGLYPEGMVASTYEVGAASGELWMQGESSFQVVGAATSELFLKRFFDKYGVKASFEQRYEYKNAVNPYLYSDYTPAHREATLGWMNSVFDTAINSVAVDRKLDPAALRQLLVAGPYSAPAAQAKGLIDKVGGVREAEDELKARAGDDAKIVEFGDYASDLKPETKMGAPVVAVIEAEGAIVTGRGKQSPFSSETNIFSDDTAKAFYDAIDDKKVKAIVFRVSSPGGVDTASEQILQAVKAAKAAGKPVVVSMGTYAASGGYWISSQASSIISEPSTLTGSIGVFGGKFALGPALSRFGLDMDDLTVGGDYADAFTSTKDFTPAQRATFSAWLDETYAAFIGRVSEGRNIPEARVREIAKGRVWTGAQALKLGLVDQIGGFYDAVDKAKALAKIAPETDVKLKRYPATKGFFQSLGEAFGASETSMRTMAAAAWIFSDPRAQNMMDHMAEARVRANGHGGVVLAPKELPSH
jgi:protease IV